ncbi:collagen-like protein [Subsaximicrobium wynnwilliamsii]|uniref:Collagen-like protein n=1 Tax=Subsaximicrobium wynnwilliamsii TaxID=291179 RepID=A0A5C6ZKV2_9FLAO|nr:collagen-like protein [Subsaximicrobium wynnwilliamsii]TXD84177.1 collagen-like protein [Subsaximicrobium wynnwilliamsii]TXD89798.1 collagen-like protein [Subsaximicrobium wynnwilliamsii]TXE03889.1 collagen-like protein [Subsaximicrobium wynnwilliamsii]
MKKILSLVAITALLFTACEGDQGPPGPPGFNGINADEYAALSFETPPINFQYFNDSGLQEVEVSLPYDILDSDVVLVYRLDEVVTIDGQATDAWSPLPQNFFLNDNDVIQYVFNHTFADVKLLIDGNFDLSTLDADFTQNQIFRIVILPADAINGLDTSNIDNVMEAVNITEFKTL